jgi:TolB-like protein/Tfp pilus assembly protein PilF
LERRLAAILAADVAGYTALMGADEVGTLKRLTELRQNIIEPLIDEHRGRVVKLMGDGVLVEFASVVDAVACALAWQASVAESEVASNAEKRLRFRIGINLGDVIVEGEDIHGDGVNIAARLEGLAEPGNIYLSVDAYRQARGKIEVDFEDLGEQVLKNVAEPIIVYRVASAGTPVSTPAKAPLTLPDKPSIAVLPFTNMSGDHEQEYFSDGITEDIITELSRFRSLFVIARNSSFTFKGQAVDVTDVGQTLGVRYIVEGSVRKAANRVRVTAQLVEAETGNHIWAERWDRELEDIFAVQDELVRTIVSTVGGRIDAIGKARATRNSEAHLRAYDFYLRAAAAEDGNTKEDYQRARQHLDRAIELDPGLAMAHHHLSLVNFVEWMAHWVDDRDMAFAAALNAENKAVAIDDTDSRIHAQLGQLHHHRRSFDEAGQDFEKAIRLNPNDFQAMALYGNYLTAIGNPEDAIEQFDQAIRLNPIEPSWIRWLRGVACFTAERYDEAIADLRSIKRPINEVRGWLAASYAGAGRLEEARATLEEFLHVAEDDMAVFPGRKLAAWDDYWHGAMQYQDEANFEHLYDALRKAGLEI